MEDKKKSYQTDNLALAPYLYMEGMKYMGCETITKDKIYKVVFSFEDPKNIGNELALDFSRSKERQYKDTWSFFRNEISSAQEQIKKNKTREK